MKSIIFLNNVLIILLSLSACHENITVEKKPSLKAMEVIKCYPYEAKDRRNSINSSSSKTYDTTVCEICWKFHPHLEVSKLNDCNYCPVFIGYLEHIISERDSLGNINDYLKDINNKYDAFGLYGIFISDFRKYARPKAKKLSDKDKDRVWASFLKIINIKEELPRLAFRFTQITKSLEEAKDKFPAHPIYLHFFKRFEAFGQQISAYTVNSQALISNYNMSLKGYQGSFELLKSFLKLIEELLAIDKIFDDKIKLGFIQGKKEKDYLLAFREDTKLFKEFFRKILFHLNLYPRKN